MKFGHSGRLYEQSFVFYDKEIKSQWVQVTGEAMTGANKGKILRLVPSVVTTWKDWKTKYPHTTILKGKGIGGFMGTYRAFVDINSFGLIVSHFGIAKLYPFEMLNTNRVINDVLDGNEIVISFNPSRRTATAWSRAIDGKILTFIEQFDPQKGFLLKDEQTNTLWDPLTGKAIGGELMQKSLHPIPNNPMLIERFPIHFPKGVIYKQ